MNQVESVTGKTPLIGMPWRRPTKYSWNSSSPSPATVSMVWSASSVTGSRRTATPYAAVLALLQLLVGFLKCLRSEEHLPGKQERRQDRRQGEKVSSVVEECQAQTHQAKSEVADQELTQSTDPQFSHDLADGHAGSE